MGAGDGAALGDDVHYLWPDCVPIWQAWQAVQTQWRVGMAGQTGLDYGAVRAWLLDAGPASRAERAQWWCCIQAAEWATLDVLAKNSKQKT